MTMERFGYVVPIPGRRSWPLEVWQSCFFTDYLRGC